MKPRRADRKKPTGILPPMALNIKNQRAERLARELASETSESVTEAVATAVNERLQRVRAANHDGAEEQRRRMRAIARDASARWIEPFSSRPHGELLYDDAGLPR